MSAALTDKQPQHTPTPWQAVKHKKGWHIACATHAIAETFGQSEENAAFIARAANSHDELVAALREAEVSVAYMAKTDPISTNRVNSGLLLARIQAALASAMGAPASSESEAA